MLLQVVVLRDSAIDAFGTPYFVTHLGSATRGLGDAVNGGNADLSVSKHPEDFALYHLGSYDDGTGMFELLPTPRQIVRAVDLVKSKS